jgi:hypothetical protein
MKVTIFYMKIFTVSALLLATASACTSMTTVTQPTQTTETVGTIAGTVVITETQTPTVSPTPTITPTLTIAPTPTPPPDLELLDVTVYPNTYNVVGQSYALMGRIRNDTNTTMLLYDDKKAFNFHIESWEYDQQGKLFEDPEYFHYIYQFDLEVGWDHKNMNCILYPGEEGVLAFKFSSRGHVQDIKSEHMTTYNGPLGVWYTYTSSYDTKSDLPKGFHYKVENLTFQDKDGVIVFDFDLYIPNDHLYPDWNYLHPIWVIFYDKDGKIIDILQKDLVHYYPGYYVGKTLHIHSSTGMTNQQPEYFDPTIDLTSEMAAQVDHLEVLSELNEEPVCTRVMQK